MTANVLHGPDLGMNDTIRPTRCGPLPPHGRMRFSPVCRPWRLIGHRIQEDLQ